jgi:hypothetical protein
VDREFVEHFHSRKDFVTFKIAFQERRCMAETATLERLVELAKQLSVVDKIRFIERLAPQIEQELKPCNHAGRKPLLGLWRGLELSEEDIARARRGAWAEFPCEDI